jgi:hypothetical protein
MYVSREFSYDNLSSVSQNVLKFYQQLTGEEWRVPFIFGQNNQEYFGYGNSGELWNSKSENRQKRKGSSSLLQ